MYLPPPQPVLNKDIRISGDVEIHPTASLAPGVILQAAPDRRIVIGADVCIGMGVIVNASQGSIEIGSGAILGSGVLLIGSCKIGNNACIGTAVTIFQADVDPMKVIEPGSILGDASRKLKIEAKQQEGQVSSSPKSQSQPNQNSHHGASKNKNYSTKFPKGKTVVENFKQKNSSPPTTESKTAVEFEVEKEKNPVVGQVYINQLLVTLFPHKKDFDSNAQKLE
ncbi:carbon dioxide concentrating mechanism protein [Waterburya agarophytonicola K14]|uniref:Carbon dioxide concentrating mechanism protein n=1 Tax=Waterburya agarophytonicola KI4 TaxID=2874699 RepID=A0A964BQ16_9CYAN|nr:carbon dioxide concentrating mechanism protein [Waterburya agarophytonicola KI4]